MTVFSTSIKIRFAHVDAAGIVFFPRYFDMVNEVIEDWFYDGLDHNYRDMIMDRERGVPTVHLDTDFQRPSELGDVLDFSLVVEYLGRSSCRVRITGTGEGRQRLVVRLTMAYMDLKARKARPWPEELRNRMQHYQVD